MKRTGQRRGTAVLLVTAIVCGGRGAAARDTAGPDAPRAPAGEAQPKSAPARATANAAAAGGAPSGSDAPRAATTSTTPSNEAAPVDAPSAGDADAERAKQLYGLGAEAFTAQRNAEAIGYFRRAAELVPSAKLTYNIALAYEEMGDIGRALAEYRSYYEQDQQADAARRDEVRGRITSLEARLAEMGVQQLFVTSDPPGATVRIGGRALGVTPWAGELSPGSYTVVLDLPGHGSSQREVTLTAQRSEQLSLSLSPAPQVDATPAPSRWSRVSPLAWTFLGVGAGTLAGGVAFELSRAASDRDAERASEPVDAAEARGAADAKQMVSLLLLGAGAGFTIGGAVLLALDLSDSNAAPASQATFGLPCAPAFCGVLARGNF
jgi:tetratricopeptide (TPR) repeat protein